MTATTTRHPTVLYAQDKKMLYLTVDLQDAKDPKITQTTNSVEFHCVVNNVNYEFKLNLYGNVLENVFILLIYSLGRTTLPIVKLNCLLKKTCQRAQAIGLDCNLKMEN